jgi:hypothetical protein
MIQAIILMARGLGWDPASLALPAAFTIDWVIGLPISGKPNAILFGTNQYSVRDNLLFGLIVCTIGYVLLLVAGATWFHWLGLNSLSCRDGAVTRPVRTCRQPTIISKQRVARLPPIRLSRSAGMRAVVGLSMTREKKSPDRPVNAERVPSYQSATEIQSPSPGGSPSARR